MTIKCLETVPFQVQMLSCGLTLCIHLAWRFLRPPGQLHQRASQCWARSAAKSYACLSFPPWALQAQGPWRVLSCGFLNHGRAHNPPSIPNSGCRALAFSIVFLCAPAAPVSYTQQYVQTVRGWAVSTCMQPVSEII